MKKKSMRTFNKEIHGKTIEKRYAKLLKLQQAQLASAKVQARSSWAWT